MKQYDLFDAANGTLAHAERLEQLHRDTTTARRTRPDTGTPCNPGTTWCGRCGADITDYDLVINHDLGYSGCPVENDPVWSQYPPRPDGRGFRGHGITGYPGTGGLLTPEDMCQRFDRHFFPDCAACGHPWGLHTNQITGGRCYLYCGCHEYQATP